MYIIFSLHDIVPIHLSDRLQQLLQWYIYEFGYTNSKLQNYDKFYNEHGKVNNNERPSTFKYHQLYVWKPEISWEIRRTTLGTFVKKCDW